jgi:hypothetical protein
MDANADNINQIGEITPIANREGITLGTIQGAGGSHTGLPFGAPGYSGTNLVQIGLDDGGTPTDPSDDLPIYWLGVGDPQACDVATCGTTDATDTNLFIATTTETPSIDEPWGFFGNTGMHYTMGTAVTEVGSHTGNTAELDFSGWTVTWNGIPVIPMGGDSVNFTEDTGKALITCSTDSCSVSSTYVLDYEAHVPIGDASGFGGVKYTLHLEGHVAPVPLPAAAWLFGSGLLGLAGVARRRRGSKS